MPMRAPMHRAPGWKPSEAKPSGWQVKRQSGSTTARGYGADWQRTRAEVMARDKGLCQPCLARGRVTAAREVDHIVGKALGGTDDAANLQAICIPCHRTKTARESRRVSSR